MIPAPSQNSVGACNLIALLILCYISSRLVALLKVIDTPVQVSDVLVVSFKVTLAFRCSLFSFSKCPLDSYLTLFQLSTLLWLDPVTTAFWHAFFDLKIVNILLLLVFVQTRLLLAEILLLSLTF
jgi:hypothetical protein